MEIDSTNTGNTTHFLGLDSRAQSAIINSSEDGPFIFDPTGPTGNKFEVYGYRGKEGDVEILEEGTFVTAYDFPNATSILLVINRALARKGQSTSLISPFIMRTAGIIVNGIAAQHSFVGDSEAHSIIVPDRGYKLDLELVNTQSSLRIRRPTDDELEKLEKVELTLPTEWDPFDSHYNLLEAIAKHRAITDPAPVPIAIADAGIRPISVSEANINSSLHAHHVNQSQWSESSRIISDVSTALDSLAFGDIAAASINISPVSLEPIDTKRFQGLTPQRLSELWHIGQKTAVRTREATYTSGTTRSGLKYGLLGRKLRSGHQQVTLRRTTAKVYADHLHMQVRGYGGVIGAMIFVTAYHFTDAYCLRSMSGTESTEACKAFIQNCGIPETMVTDGHNSLLGAQWKQLCRE